MKVKLEELVEEVSERTTVNNQHPVLTSSRSGIYLQEEYFKKQVASKDNTGYRVIRKGEFTYRAMSDTGEFYPNKLECIDIGIVSPAYPVFKIRDNRILPDYLKYYFKSRSFQKSITAFVQGSTRASMKFGKMKLISIDLPDKDKQNQILNIIRILESIIDKYELEIDCLNNLIKARFVEMFGDPSKGDKIKTDKRKIGEIATVTKLAGFEFTKYINYQEEGDIIMLRGLNCKNGHLVLDNIKWIDQAISDALPRSKLYKGDILMTYAGTIGDVAMVDKDNTYHLAPNVGKISINNTNEINPVFLTQLFLNTHDYIMSFASQVAQASINMQKIRDFDYYFPPIELQNQFATFVAHVDKSKFAVQKSLEKTKLLFDSLMQEYFG